MTIIVPLWCSTNYWVTLTSICLYIFEQKFFFVVYVELDPDYEII